MTTSSTAPPYPAAVRPFPLHPELVSCAPYTLPAYPLTASSTSVIGVLLRIGFLVVLAGTEIGTLSWLEGLISVTNNINDAAFVVTQPLYEILRDNTVLKDVLCFMVGMTYALLVLYASWVSARYEQYGLFFAGVTVMVVRVVVGALTTLPIPKDFIPSDYDIPPTTMQWAGSSVNAEAGYTPFITFYSGHTGLITVYTMFARARLSRRAYLFALCFLCTQALYMFASRGHYVIDILAGYVVGRWFAGQIPRINRELYRWSLFRTVLFTRPPEGWAEDEQQQREFALFRAALASGALANGTYTNATGTAALAPNGNTANGTANGKSGVANATHAHDQ